MAKRLICLMLAALMLLVVFASCSKDDDAISNTVDDASRFTKSFNMWVITESQAVATASKLLLSGVNPTKLTAEQQAQIDALSATEPELKEALNQVYTISEAINKITKKKFRTQLNIKYLTEAEYYTAVEKAFVDHENALAEAKKNGTTLAVDATTQETVLNEYGIPELKYPNAYDFQVDILYVGNAVKYREYVDKEYLVALDGLLENSAVRLSYYVNNVLINSSAYYGAIYGVSNNATIGDYTYLAIDEALVNEYIEVPENFDASVFDEQCFSFLNYIHTRPTPAGEEKIYPIYSENGKVDLNMLHYWGYDLDSMPGAYLPSPEDFSIFGGFYYAGSVQGSAVNCANLLTSSIWSSYMQKKVYYENTPDFITQNAEDKAAVRILKGTYDELKSELDALEADNYKIVTVENPRATDEAVFGSMFAIGSHTTDEERAMEIITYLNTNAEFRNLLQYGVENINYTLKSVLDDEGEVKTDAEGNALTYAEMLPTNVYRMDVNKTGNVFIAYPTSEADIYARENGKVQNLDVTAYPTTGIFFNTADYKVDETSIRVLNAVSEKFNAKVLQSLTTPTQVAALYNTAVTYTTNDAGMATFLLDAIGEDVTYTVGTKTETVTAAQLAAAIRGMREATLATGKDAVQSVSALYKDWLENSGVNG